MNRYSILGGLIVAQLALSGCSGAHTVDRAEVGQQRLAATHEPAQRRAAASSPRRERPRQRVAAPVVASSADVEMTGTVGAGANRSRQHRPWPKTGTPEYEQLRAEEMEQEQRVQRAIRSICKGC